MHKPISPTKGPSERPASPPLRWVAPLAVSLAVAAVAALAVDMPLARWCYQGRIPNLLRELFDLCEVFGHGIGVALIAISLYVLDRPRRWAAVRVLAGAWSAGVGANLLKLLVVRPRPRDFLPLFPASNVWATFQGWLPGLRLEFHAASFPSAHVATSVGLAMVLAALYPQGRWWFALLAVCVAMQRLDSSAHYLSDTLAGALVGLAVGYVHLRFTVPSRWWQGLERRLGLPETP